MKQNKKKKVQQKPIQLKTSQILQLMEEQIKKVGDQEQYNGLCFTKIPITKFTPEINRYLQKFKGLENLCFLKCNLESLDGLNINGEKIINITINYNQLKGDSLKVIGALFPNVKNLNLRHNQISQLEDLGHLKLLKQVEYLDLSFNPVKRYLDYKKTVFQYLPQLQNLDNDLEIDDSQDNSSQEMWLSRSEGDSESEWREDSEESEQEKKAKKKVKK